MVERNKQCNYILPDNKNTIISARPILTSSPKAMGDINGLKLINDVSDMPRATSSLLRWREYLNPAAGKKTLLQELAGMNFASFLNNTTIDKRRSRRMKELNTEY